MAGLTSSACPSVCTSVRTAVAMNFPGSADLIAALIDAGCTHIYSADGTSGPVASWSDLSGGSRHATQGTTGHQPGVSTDAGGRTILTPDGVDDHLSVPTVAATAFTVVVALTPNTVSGGKFVWGTANTGGTFTALQPNSASGVRLYYHNQWIDEGGSSTTGQAQVLSVEVQANIQTVYRDGVVIASGTLANAPNVTPNTLFSLLTTVQADDSDIYALPIYPGVDSVVRGHMEAWVAAEAGVTL